MSDGETDKHLELLPSNNSGKYPSLHFQMCAIAARARDHDLPCTSVMSSFVCVCVCMSVFSQMYVYVSANCV